METGLKVRLGNTLALVGGDVKLDGGILQAPSGRVELGGVAGVATVGLDTATATLRFPNGAALEDVSLTNGAQLEASTFGQGNAGNVVTS